MMTREDLETLLADISAIDTWHRGSPSYEHDAGWFKDRVVRLIEERIAATPASSVADAVENPSQDWIDGFSQGKIAARQSAIAAGDSVADAAGAKPVLVRKGRTAKDDIYASRSAENRGASIADTAGAKLSASNLPEEFRINDPADYKRTMDAQFPDAARPVAWRLRLQDGSLDYSNCEIEPSGADLKDATENGRVFEPLYLAAPPAPSVADAAGASEDARDAARYRWLRQQRFEFNHSRITPVRPDKLDTMIDAAIAKESGNDTL